jgi:transcriptional regulator with XRE-family HTH domain
MKGKKKDTIEADQQMKLIIGGRIKRVRNRKNMSAQTLADQISMTRNALTQIETGRNAIGAIQLWKIAGALHCSVSEFFPEVPDSSSLQQNDIAQIAEENTKAAVYMKKAYRIK